MKSYIFLIVLMFVSAISLKANQNKNSNEGEEPIKKDGIYVIYHGERKATSVIFENDERKETIKCTKPYSSICHITQTKNSEGKEVRQEVQYNKDGYILTITEILKD